MGQFRKMIKGEVLAITTSLYGQHCIFNLANRLCIKHPFDPSTPKPYYSGWVSSGRPKIHPDGTKAYISNGDQSPYMRILDLTTGLYLPNPAALPTGRPYGFELSPDNTELCVTFNAAPYFNRYDLSDLSIKTAPAVAPTGNAGNAAYSPNGNWLCITHDITPFFTVYNRSNMSKVTITGALPTNYTSQAKFSPNSAYLVIGGQSAGTANTVCIYNTSDWSRLTNSSQLSMVVNDIQFSPSGNRLGVAYNSYGTNAFRWLNMLNPTGGWSAINVPAPWNTNSSSSAMVGFRWLDEDTIAMVSRGSSGLYALGTGNVFILTTANVLLDVWPLPGPGSNLEGLDWFLNSPPRRRLAGTVKNASNVGVARAVRAYDKYSGDIIGETISSAADGSFSMYVYTAEPVVVLSMGSGTEVTKLFDNVVAAPLP